MIKIISFDFDGTIAKHTFADAFWLEGVPALYAKQHHVDVEAAKKYLFKEYDKIGDNRIEWYDPGYWFDRFDLQADWKKMLLKYLKNVEIYPEVPSVLNRLSTQYSLIISSNAKKEFIDVQLRQNKLSAYFDQIFSSTSDFHTVKKVTDFYAMICKKLSIQPQEMVHVGDHKEFDYLSPQKLGITSYYLDRKKNTTGNHVVSDLKEFETNILGYSPGNSLDHIR
ncbi:MAG: HAD family hydrolase [Euryarchaeota archaeon]|nr:HAD family hydrolase [Euryarchaeota archaeon]